MALIKREAIVRLTQDLKYGLRKYELSEEEWKVAEQLRDVLKVRSYLLRCLLELLTLCAPDL